MNKNVRKIFSFMGLVEDDYTEYLNDDERNYQPEEAPVTRLPARATRPLRDKVAPVAPLTSVETSPMPPMRPRPQGLIIRPITEVVIQRPASFDEAPEITTGVRQGHHVVLVMNATDPTVRRRLLDYVAGTAFALRAKVEVLEKGAVYLISPAGSTLEPEARLRLRATQYRTATPS